MSNCFFFPLSYKGDFLMVMHIFLSDINSFFDFSPPARLQISVNTGEKITLSGSWWQGQGSFGEHSILGWEIMAFILSRNILIFNACQGHASCVKHQTKCFHASLTNAHSIIRKWAQLLVGSQRSTQGLSEAESLAQSSQAVLAPSGSQKLP